ncbi:Maf family protein [Simplicispira psychrophila]|uniref:Maf family protein n=1 Tax=Simplicispira psychrophila TaxID=80882 RepID=UPI000484E97B|nr:Maf family protein [Simplicispira psychrophila]
MPELIYLASQSPRRSQLLDQLGVRHEILVPDADEAEEVEALEALLPGESPSAYVQRVTGLKLDAAVLRRARRGLPEAPILCADTTVARGRVIYGKPLDAQDAVRLLSELGGQTHRVLTALALQVPVAGSDSGVCGTRRLTALSVSRVTFADVSPAQIDAYVATGEPMGKAGAYGIQGQAAAHIRQISGSYSAIMGLPLYEAAQLLRAAGFAV